MALAIASLLVAVLSLFAWPRLFKPVALLLLVSRPPSSYFMLQYGVVIDATMMANVANTDVREVRDLLSWPCSDPWCSWPACQAGGCCASRCGAAPGCPGLAQPGHRSGGAGGRGGAGAAGVPGPGVADAQPQACALPDQSAQRRVRQRQVGWPTSCRAAARRCRRSGPTPGPVRPTPPASGRPCWCWWWARPRGQPTSRWAAAPAHQPQLERLRAEGGLTYFSQVRSCGTNTQASVPCMFSHLGKEGHEASSQRLREPARRALAGRPRGAVDGQPVRLQGAVRGWTRC